MASTPYDSYDHLPEACQSIATAYMGPPLVGWMAQFVLYGILAGNVAGYVGSDNYKNDSRSIKALLWTVMTLTTACTGVNIYQSLFHSLNQDRTADQLFMVELFDSVPLLLIGFEGAIVQSYLAFRVAKLFQDSVILKNGFLCGILALIFVGWLASIGVAVAGYSYSFGYTDSLLPFTYNILVGIWSWVGAGVDLLLTAILIVCLRRSVLGFNPNTDGAIRRIMRVALQTASYTTVFGIAGALMSTAFPSTDESTVNALFAFEFPLASLYALSFLTTLDSRKPIKRNDQTTSFNIKASGDLTGTVQVDQVGGSKFGKLARSLSVRVGGGGGGGTVSQVGASRAEGMAAAAAQDAITVRQSVQIEVDEPAEYQLNWTEGTGRGRKAGQGQGQGQAIPAVRVSSVDRSDR